ncbi:WecB/TagA/CpsF family glycosyltransferase [Stutzerimonas urumqiensis]|uniref:WecB/TagA/CpsF family glycosyltransferase n=1 Tax=Stutzerimonas urumqiensis TaxID=638269 RepID=UPI003DA4283A
MNELPVKAIDPLINRLRLMEESDIAALIAELCAVKTPTILGFLNQHGYNLAQRSPRIYHSFTEVDCLLRDGIGIKMACKFNRLEPGANLNGSDFIPRLFSHLADDPAGNVEFFAMGTREPWLSQGAKALFGEHPFAAIDGFRSPEEYVDFVMERHVAGHFPVVVLAMGMPKQEEIAVLLRQRLDGPALFICGGAILDFAAERFPRAPMLVRQIGMEWLFRLVMEPKRLFTRYAIGIPLFFFYALRNAGVSLPAAERAASDYKRQLSERLVEDSLGEAVKHAAQDVDALATPRQATSVGVSQT